MAVVLSIRTQSGTEYALFDDASLLIRRTDGMGGHSTWFGTVPEDGVHKNVTFDGMTPNGGIRFKLDSGSVITTTPVAQKNAFSFR